MIRLSSHFKCQILIHQYSKSWRYWSCKRSLKPSPLKAKFIKSFYQIAIPNIKIKQHHLWWIQWSSKTKVCHGNYMHLKLCKYLQRKIWKNFIHSNLETFSNSYGRYIFTLEWKQNTYSRQLAIKLDFKYSKASIKSTI